MRIYLLIFLLLFTASCKKDEDADPQNQRTVLVYMGGDNNLYQETDDKIEALRKAYTRGMGRLLVYQDAAGITPRLLEITSGAGDAGVTQVLKSYPEENSASAAVFKRVLEDVRAEAPAPSYGLIFFSHASGWLPQRTLIRPYAVAQDGKEDLELREFASVIPDGFFDFIIFEACFMTGIEVLYQLKDKTDFILSSSAEILSPGFTPVYSELLPFLFRPQAALEDFARVFFEHYDNMSGDYRSATISLVRTEALPALAAWIKENVSGTLPPAELNTIQHYDRYPDYRLFFDFEDYYQRLSSPESHAELSRLISDAVIYKAATPSFMPSYNGFGIKHFSGMTSYIPQDKFTFLNGEYMKLLWTEEAGI